MPIATELRKAALGTEHMADFYHALRLPGAEFKLRLEAEVLHCQAAMADWNETLGQLSGKGRSIELGQGNNT